MQILFYFALFSLNKKDCTTVHAKCLVFQRFSQETLVFVSKVPKTQYQFLARPHSHKTPYQTLIFSCCPHRLLLVFWELMFGYVTHLYRYSNFLMLKLYPKRSFVSTPHSSDHDLNVETLVSKCIWRWNILYHMSDEHHWNMAIINC